MKEIFRIKYAILLLLVLVAVLYLVATKEVVQKEVSSLVIFGDNIVSGVKPFVEDGGVYIPSDTVGKTIDDSIFYDNISSKIIITTPNKVVKMKVGEKKISINLEEQEIANELKQQNNKVYIPINILKDIYDIEVMYNEEYNTVVIDKKNNDTATVEYNKTLVYSDIATGSPILTTLNKGTKLIAYTESLEHKRWIKIKTEDNIVGYVFKDACTIEKATQEPIDKTVDEKEKVVMFWQYGNGLDVLGDTKVTGVNVVSPTLYELANSKGEIDSKAAKDYVAKAKNLGYKVWPIITNGIDNVNYSKKDTSLLMNSETARENLIKNILEIMQRDKLDGINIDFENMETNDRLLFTQFIRELAPLVRAQGKVLSVDVYFVEYIDRKGVGEATDYIMLMGYDHRGGWSSESGPIAEIPWVEENLQSLINDSKIPANKIILGVPFYTRLWTEKAGATKPTTETYTIKQAINYITTNALTPTYDEKNGQNYVEHTKGSYTYKMWLEDATSMKNRVELVNTYTLAGIAGWRKGFETQDIWTTIAENLKK